MPMTLTAPRCFEAACKMGLEGIVSKRRDKARDKAYASGG